MTNNSRFSIALIHYPVFNKRNEIVSTSITNLDIHDIARSCRTFGIGTYYIVHPIKAQRDFASTLINHWQTGQGRIYNPDRTEGIMKVKLVSSIEDAIKDKKSIFPSSTLHLISTAAGMKNPTHSFSELKKLLLNSNDSFIMLLGTGWGLSDEMLLQSDIRLQSINGSDSYNHLSVRSAASIILDRLFGII